MNCYVEKFYHDNNLISCIRRSSVHGFVRVRNLLYDVPPSASQVPALRMHACSIKVQIGVA